MKRAIPFGLLLALALISCGCTTSSSPSSPVVPAAPTAVVLTTPLQTLAHSEGSGVTIPIRIKENSFDPDFVTVKVGTTIIWTNEDPGTHTVTYTGNDAMRFDSGPLATGQWFENTFTESGRYTYTCKQHSFMTGTVLVQ